MVNLEITREGYEGIPAMAETLTEDDLRQVARGRDVQLIPHLVAAVKKAQENITVTGVTVTDENGNTVSGTLTLKVGDEMTLLGSHEPATSTTETKWTNSAATKLGMAIDPDDVRRVTVKALKAGSSTLKCACGAGSFSITVTVQ